MNKKRILFLTVGALALIASIVMYKVGNNSGHLNELADTFWIPIPLAVVSIIAGLLVKQKQPVQ